MVTFEQEHKTIAERILYLTQKYPSVINDYRRLIQYYWYYFDGTRNFIPIEVLGGLTQPESISRIYRMLVEQGKIEVPFKTKISRVQREKNFKKYFGEQ